MISNQFTVWEGGRIFQTFYIRPPTPITHDVPRFAGSGDKSVVKPSIGRLMGGGYVTPYTYICQASGMDHPQNETLLETKRVQDRDNPGCRVQSEFP